MRRTLRRTLLVVGALTLAVLASSCAKFESYELTQTGGRTVRAAITVCETDAAANPCADTGNGNGWTGAQIAFQVPTGTTAPASFVTTGGGGTFSRTTSYSQTGLGTTTGKEWLIYEGSVPATFGTVDRIAGTVDFTVPSTMTGTFGVTATVRVNSGGCTGAWDGTCRRDTQAKSLTLAAGPAITITAPDAAASYPLGSDVDAAYSCTGAPTCTGTVADGAAVDTSTVGTHTFTVNAADAIGNASTKSVTYHVAPSVTVSGPATAEEGSTHTYSYVVAPADATVDEHCPAGATYVDTPAALSFDCTFGTPGAATVSVVAAKSGEETTGTRAVTVTKKAMMPVVVPVAEQQPAPVQHGGPPVPATFTSDTTNVGLTVGGKTSPGGVVSSSVTNTNPFWVAVRLSLFQSRAAANASSAAVRARGLLGTTTFTVAPDGTRTAKVQLNRRGRALLRRGKFRAAVEVKARDPQRNLRRSTSAVTVRR